MKNLTNEQLLEGFENYVAEIRGRLKQVDSYFTIEKDKPVYKTEKRVAKVGERILITNAMDNHDNCENGDVMEVSEVLGRAVFIKNPDVGLWSDEYEVIIEQPKYNTVKRHAVIGERILTPATGLVYTVSCGVGGNGGVDVEELEGLSHKFAFTGSEYAVIIEDAPKLTNNQQRWETIKRAREFVEERKLKGTFSGISKVHYRVRKYGTNCVIEFVVNEDKRTVVAIARGAVTNDIENKGIAKCQPTDVFNVDIGKAIALAKVVEMDAPEEFTHAVQPDRVVVGMELAWSSELYRLNEIDGNTYNLTFLLNGKTYKDTYYEAILDGATITNDTNAIYEGSDS